MLPPQTSIGHVHLVVADLASVRSFYQDALGFKVAGMVGDTTFLSSTGQYPFLLLLTHRSDARPRPRRSAGLYHFAILFPSRADLAGALRRLLEVGWPLEGASDHGVSEAIYLHDPEGNGIEIYADRDRGRWPRRGSDLAMWTQPLDVDALLATARSGWEGMPTATRVGHIHLHVGDLHRSEAFYSGVLGFDVMVRAYPGALFLAAGGYHHHIGLNIWAGPNVPPADPQTRGLRAFAVRLPDRDALADAVRRVRDAGVEIEAATDHGYHLTVTMRDPDGIGVSLVAERAGQQTWKEEPIDPNDL